MDYGRFIEGGKKYEIITPFTPASWKNYLYNDEYCLELDQTLQGEGYLVKDYNKTLCFHPERYFYLVDRKSGEVWNPNCIPLAKKYDSYSCTHGMWSTKLQSVQQGIKTMISVVVPQEGTREWWSVSIQNQSSEEREISLYTLFGFYDHGVMGGECVYDEESQIIYKYAHPYHTMYEEKAVVEKEKAYLYLFADRRPDSYDMSKRRFFGNQGSIGVPQGIVNGALSGISGEAEDFCGAFSYNLYLKEGEEITILLEAGAAATKEYMVEQKKQFGQKFFKIEIEKTQNAWEKMLDTFYVETPDENLNAFANYWLKKQITLLTRQNRGSSYCPVRNQLQDAMGYAMIAPNEAGRYLFDVMRLQQKNGFIQQWHDTTGAAPRGLCLLKHTDGPVWLVICMEAYIRQNGRKNILSERIPYLDGEDGTVFEHLLNALFYLYESVGTHGLCLIGDGDWNDPINGVGREGKGESVWLSMALVYATKLLLSYMDKESDEFRSLTTAAEKMKQAINEHAWSEKWYAAAIHDDGTVIGGCDDRLFLNTQSWAILAEVVPKERRQLLEEALKSLETPFGPIILFPPFEAWDSHWGRISVKKSGTTENGSVYCHASMFLAYAQAKEKDADGLYDTLWRTLPTNPENSPVNNLQVPIYLSNYYYGLAKSDNFGRSSQHYGTGTAAWMQMLIMEELVGIKATVEGLYVQPLIPKQWEKIRCTRKYREAVYDFSIKRGREAAIYVDGALYEKEILPYQDGRAYQIEITIG